MQIETRHDEQSVQLGEPMKNAWMVLALLVLALVSACGGGAGGGGQGENPPSGYVPQGGLTWMPVTFSDTYANAEAYCANTLINGQPGWRMPTQAELSALYSSGAMIGHGWVLDNTRSSTPGGAGTHYVIHMVDGTGGWGNDSPHTYYVSCVRGGGGAITATATTTAQNLTLNTAMTNFSPLTPSGGTAPYTYSHTGSVPTGISLNTSTGIVSGTPTATYATASLTFSVKDANNIMASTTSTVNFTVGSTLPAGYVVQGGLTWMPPDTTTFGNWTYANNFCANFTINGLSGWRVPTQSELSALSTSGAWSGQGWWLTWVWSSTVSRSGYHYMVTLYDGVVSDYNDLSGGISTMCVR